MSIFKKIFFLLVIYIIFSINRGNAQNTFVVGTYTGTGAALTISGIGFQPDAVIIKSVTNTGLMFIKTNGMGSTSSRAFRSNAGLVTDAIDGFNSNGFTLSTNANVNTNGTTYYFTAFQASSAVRVGSYTGNGPAASQNITLSPAAQAGFTLVIPSNTAGGYAFYTRDGTNYAWFFDSGSSSGNGSGNPAPANGFTAYGTTGFAAHNASGVVYHYISFVNTTGVCQTGGYTGDGTNDRNITLTGTTFEPGFMLITKSGSNLVMRNSAYGATDATQHYTATADAADKIQLFNIDGFQIGTNTAVNTNTTAYTYMALGGNVTVLPIELMNFDLSCLPNDTGINIHWTTASEINNDYFTVERSVDGISFQTIATIKGAGNSSKVLDYNFIDPEPIQGNISYYRLCQTDYDGKTEIFKIVSTDCQNELSFFELNIIQNPIQNEILLYDLNMNRDGLVQLEITDMLGRVIKKGSFYHRKGANRYCLEVNNLSKGVYHLSVSNKSDQQTAKFVK